MYKIDRSSPQFRRDVRKAAKRGLDLALLENAIDLLASGAPMPPEYLDHPLKGEWRSFRECHIKDDWLLVYQKSRAALVLALFRTGAHTELFD